MKLIWLTIVPKFVFQRGYGWIINVLIANVHLWLKCKLCHLLSALHVANQKQFVTDITSFNSIKFCIKTGPICPKSHFTSIFQRSKVKTLLFDRKKLCLIEEWHNTKVCLKRIFTFTFWVQNRGLVDRVLDQFPIYRKVSSSKNR